MCPLEIERAPIPASNTLIWVVLPLLALAVINAQAGTSEAIPAEVSLCDALERIQPGDKIPVVVSGIYVKYYLFDPDEPVCRMDIERSTCIEFASDIQIPDRFSILHDDPTNLGMFVTFFGTLHGPPVASIPKPDPSFSSLQQSLVRFSKLPRLYCGAAARRTKLVVESILDYSPGPDISEWEPSRRVPREDPMPVSLSMPSYPHFARKLDAEGFVLIDAEVVNGQVTVARAKFGEAIFVDEALRNISTWRFDPEVTTNLTVEYEFRLEKRTFDEGRNPRYEMRLPDSIRIIGATDDAYP